MTFKPTAKHKKEKIESQINLLNEIVKVKIGPSAIHGVGVIALRDLKKGELMNLDATFQLFDLPYKKMRALRPEIKQILLERWPLIMKGSLFVYPDTRMQAYMNHSDTPNYDCKTDKMLKKIKKGEELTEDYRQIEGATKLFTWLKS